MQNNKPLNGIDNLSEEEKNKRIKEDGLLSKLENIKPDDDYTTDNNNLQFNTKESSNNFPGITDYTSDLENIPEEYIQRYVDSLNSLLYKYENLLPDLKKFISYFYTLKYTHKPGYQSTANVEQYNILGTSDLRESIRIVYGKDFPKEFYSKIFDIEQPDFSNYKTTSINYSSLLEYYMTKHFLNQNSTPGSVSKYVDLFMLPPKCRTFFAGVLGHYQDMEGISVAPRSIQGRNTPNLDITTKQIMDFAKKYDIKNPMYYIEQLLIERK